MRQEFSQDKQPEQFLIAICQIVQDMIQEIRPLV